ncbi:MAG: sigma-70 family RNA polymerase sigma factor [Isosphaeraceae bacterium]
MGNDRATWTGTSLAALVLAGRFGDLNDADLLASTAALDEDANLAEAAFSTLIGRHGPMVLRTCRTILQDHHDAEDAFQATFLLLVQRARRLRVTGSLGPWLHAVALRVSLAARRLRARRPRVVDVGEVQQSVLAQASAGPLETAMRREADESLHCLIDRLPPRLRSCLVLCDLEGMTYAAAARTLGIPVGTVQSRLARARSRLRTQLSERQPNILSDDASGGPLPGLAAVQSAVPATLCRQTARFCTFLAEGGSSAVPVIRPAIAAMMKGATAMNVPGRLARSSLALAVLFLAGTLAAHSQPPSGRGPDPPKSPPSQSPAVAPARGPGLAPVEVEVSAGRGKVLAFELDHEGNRQLIKTRDRRGNLREQHKETDLELNWAVVIGVVPNRSILKQQQVDMASRDLLLQLYRRVELSRQEQTDDGSWSEWQLVDPAPTIQVLDNLPEVDEELLPPRFRLDSLVDPLPYQRNGKWERVNPGRLLAKVRSPEVVNPNLDPRIQASDALEADELMFRSFDFSVVRGRTYRYRARIVLQVRQSNRLNEKAGNWSRPTEPVTVP